MSSDFCQHPDTALAPEPAAFLSAFLGLCSLLGAVGCQFFLIALMLTYFWTVGALDAGGAKTGPGWRGILVGGASWLEGQPKTAPGRSVFP